MCLRFQSLMITTDSFLSQHHYYLVSDQIRLLGAFSAESPVNEDHCFSTVSIRDPPLRSGSVAQPGAIHVECLTLSVLWLNIKVWRLFLN